MSILNKNESYILVTVSAGFIGSALVKRLLLNGKKVVGIDNLKQLKMIFKSYNKNLNLKFKKFNQSLILRKPSQW